MRTVTNSSMEQIIKYVTFNKIYTNEFMHSLQAHLINEINADKNKPFYRAYLNIVKETANLINSLNIKDSFTKCSFFYYLLWLGIFSQDRSFTFSDQNRISNMSALGADIMLGKSACLNNTDMLSRVLRATNTESYIIGCEVADIKAIPSTQAKTSSKYTTLTATQKEPSELSPSKEAESLLDYGNHALSIFVYQGKYYLADPTNLTFLSITDFLEATYTGERITADLKPIVTLMLEDVDVKHFKDLIIESFIFSDEPGVDISFINNHSNTSKLLVADNMDLITDFHHQITKDIDTVCKTLK